MLDCPRVSLADRHDLESPQLRAGHFNANLDATGLLQQQANTLQSDISKLEDQRRDYRLKESIISVEESQGLLAERLKRLDQNLSEIRIQRVRLETQATEAKTDLARSPTPFENPMLANYGNNAILRQNLDQLRGQQKVLANTYGPNHPKMKEVLLQIAATETTLKNNFDLANVGPDAEGPGALDGCRVLVIAGPTEKVPVDDAIPGDSAWPTQPFPVKPPIPR